MPQMAPLNWLTLYFLFILIFFSFNILNYYNYSLNPQKKSLTKYKISFNWKW